MSLPSELRSLALTDGRHMVYQEQGTGAPIVLVHGSLCDCRYWKPQVGSLGEHFRVIAPCLPRYWPEKWSGHGDGFSIDEHRRDLALFIDALGCGPVHLVGHSRGGAIAYELTRSHPELVYTLTLADPGLYLGPSSEDNGDPRGNFRERAAQLVGDGNTDAGLELFIDHVSGAGTWRRMVPWFRDMTLDNANTLLAQIHDPLPRFEPRHAQAISCPTLLIGGALSPAPYPQIIDALEKHLPDVRRVRVVGSSHGMNLGHPRAFNSTLTLFAHAHKPPGY